MSLAKVARIIPILFLAGCATSQGPAQPVQIQRVEVPVAVSCTAPLPPEPAYADTAEALKAAPDIWDLYTCLTQRSGWSLAAFR